MNVSLVGDPGGGSWALVTAPGLAARSVNRPASRTVSGWREQAKWSRQSSEQISLIRHYFTEGDRSRIESDNTPKQVNPVGLHEIVRGSGARPVLVMIVRTMRSR